MKSSTNESARPDDGAPDALDQRQGALDARGDHASTVRRADVRD
jgi:hypothetical protein